MYRYMTVLLDKSQYEPRSLKKLKEVLDLQHTCGYVTFLNTGYPAVNDHAASIGKFLQYLFSLKIFLWSHLIIFFLNQFLILRYQF